MALLALTGCSDGVGDRGRDPVESDSATETSARSPAARLSPAELAAAVLPDAPWFELPDDWYEQHPVISPNAKLDAHFMTLAERQLAENPADGGGRAWLVAAHAIGADAGAADSADADGTRPIVPASSVQRLELVFEVGPHGIDEGGQIFIMPEPFWSWTESQVENLAAPGYTTATSRDEGVELVPVSETGTFRVAGRGLAPGERIDIVVGAGPRGTIVDEYAERDSEILIAVDADGDGTRGWIKESAKIDIGPRAGTRLVAFGPAEVGPGAPIEIVVAIVDGRGNRAVWPTEQVPSASHDASETALVISRTDGDALAKLGVAERVELDGRTSAPYRIRFDAPGTKGTIRLSIQGTGALEAMRSDVNPIVVRDASERLIWADLHGHSRLSDGSGVPEDYFSYARDVARLDAVALTDHDHWGIRPLDESPDLAARILATALRFHDPGRFVTLPGFEWTSWLHGHRHVLYFEEEAPIFSAFDEKTDRPDELWDALRGRAALTLAHHSAGEPVATNWAFRPDPELEPLTEISSIHGMSEAADAPLPVYGAVPGNYVRDVLLRGAQLGFIGSGDSHDGHPGLAHLAAEGQSGLAGLFTASLDRPGLLEAMKSRRTFATNGIRPWLSVSIDDTQMGGVLPHADSADKEQLLRIRYEGTAPVERIDLIRSGRVAQIEGPRSLSMDLERRIPRLQPGDFHYVRILQEGGGVAWSSPVFVDAEITVDIGSSERALAEEDDD